MSAYFVRGCATQPQQTRCSDLGALWVKAFSFLLLNCAPALFPHLAIPIAIRAFNLREKGAELTMVLARGPRLDAASHIHAVGPDKTNRLDRKSTRLNSSHLGI